MCRLDGWMRISLSQTPRLSWRSSSMENGWRYLGAGKTLSHLQSVLADVTVLLCCLPA